MAEPDNLEMQTVSMIKVLGLGEGMVFGILATISPVVLLRLGIQRQIGRYG